MNGRIDAIQWVVLIGAAMSLGCASPKPTSDATPMLCPEGVTREQAGRAAYDVLSAMHFSFEKLDIEQGVIMTRPLRGAQLFEFWRSDNVGAYNTAEANIQSIRRTVELRVREQAEGDGPGAEDANSVQPIGSGLCIECVVQVQRLALPGNEVAGVSQAYQIHTRSLPTLQVFDVTPQQRAGMAWIDLGPDPELAAEVLKRIERKLQH
jgi:hypothetical protein